MEGLSLWGHYVVVHGQRGVCACVCVDCYSCLMINVRASILVMFSWKSVDLKNKCFVPRVMVMARFAYFGGH